MNVLAIDQGTSSTKALVISNDGTILGAGEAGIRPLAVGGGGVEQDPAELWSSVLEAGRRAVSEAARGGAVIGAIGLANQGETVLAWDRHTGEPIGRAISWQDRRAAGVCDTLAPHAQRLHEITGLALDPYFVAPKIRWLRDNVTREGVVTTSDTWLVHALTGEVVTDVTTASRSLLMDLDQRRWSVEAADVFGLDIAELPEVVGCAQVIGDTDVFGPRLPLSALVVDQQGALIGEHCLLAGEAKCTYGTGAFLLATSGPEPRRSIRGLAASVAWQVPGSAAYCLDGQVYSAGSAIDWLLSLGLIASADDVDALGSTVPGAGGVIAVPALAGLGAPYWRPGALGAIEGLGLSTRPAHLVRAVVEGIAAQVALLCQAAAADLGRELVGLRVDGGLTESRLLMQAQADLLQIPVEVFPSPHATAFGVAALARLGAGAVSSLDAAVSDPAPASGRSGRCFEPAISADQAGVRLGAWEAALGRVLAAEAERASYSRPSGSALR